MSVGFDCEKGAKREVQMDLNVAELVIIGNALELLSEDEKLCDELFCTACTKRMFALKELVKKAVDHAEETKK